MNLSLPAYICGPLTELDPQTREKTKKLYENLASLCLDTIGVRAFVPHEHYDPIKHADFTPRDVDRAERKQVCEKTSVLIVVAIEPSWGGGIEVEQPAGKGLVVLRYRRFLGRLGGLSRRGLFYVVQLAEPVGRVVFRVGNGGIAG